MKKTWSILSLLLIVLGLSLVVLGYETGITEGEPKDEYEEPFQPPTYPPKHDDDGNGDGDGNGGDSEPPPKLLPPKSKLDIFGIQVSQMEFIGYVLIAVGVLLMLFKW